MITGFVIEKLDVEKKKPDHQDKITVKNNLRITDVEEETLPFKDKKAALKFKFSYEVDYEPKVGKININGSILYIGEESDELIKEFKKEKKIRNEKTSLAIINTISNKCNVKALELCQDINLPPPFNLPRLKFDTKAANYIG